MPSIVVEGTSIHFEYAQSFTADQTLIFLNGMTQTTAHWMSHVRAFSGRYSVLTYDARGQGRSGVGESPFAMADHVADLHAVCAHLGIEKTILVGFSHGARIALGVAAQRPNLVEALVLASATATPSALAKTIVTSWIRVLELGGLEAVAWASLPTILGDAYLVEHAPRLDGIIRATARRNSPEGVRKLLEGMQRFPSVQEMAQSVRVPTVVFFGSEDPLVTAEGARELARLCEGDAVAFEGVGHTLPIEAPLEFRNEIGRFLDGLD
jgi:3-oxoadipate enol-lactonase